MDVDLIKRLAKELVIGMVTGMVGTVILDKMGVSVPMIYLLVGGGLAAYGYMSVKKEEKEVEARMAQSIESEIERRLREKVELADALKQLTAEEKQGAI